MGGRAGGWVGWVWQDPECPRPPSGSLSNGLIAIVSLLNGGECVWFNRNLFCCVALRCVVLSCVVMCSCCVIEGCVFFVPVLFCIVISSAVVCSSVVWCGVAWRGKAWRGVVWCSAVCCAEGAVTKRQWLGCLARGKTRNGRAVCLRVRCAWCVAHLRQGAVAPIELGGVNSGLPWRHPAALPAGAVEALAGPTPSRLCPLLGP